MFINNIACHITIMKYYIIIISKQECQQFISRCVRSLSSLERDNKVNNASVLCNSLYCIFVYRIYIYSPQTNFHVEYKKYIKYYKKIFVKNSKNIFFLNIKNISTNFQPQINHFISTYYL